MRNVIIILGALSLIVTFLCSCQRNRYKEIVATRIQYDVPISQADPQLNWWVNSLEGSRREPFIKRIMEAAGSGEVKVYDYFNNLMTTDQVKSVGADTIYSTLTRSYPPYTEYDTMVVKKIEYQDISKIRFLEEWRWNPKSLEMIKIVIGFAPVYVRTYGDDSYNQLLFWIYLDDKYPGEIVK